MRFHLVSLPHTQTTSEFISCAYTQKVVKFARMMKARGHEIVLYSGEENEAPCDEHVVIVRNREQRKWFGKKDLSQMYPITWGPEEEHWVTTNKRVIRHITKGLKEDRYDKHDFVCIIAGTCNQLIDASLPNTCPEYGVGYTGVFTHAAYESRFHQATVYSIHKLGDGRPFDTVIPNYFDLDEFEFNPGPREDHLLYVGRIILRKGIHVAAQAAERSGHKLLVAGQGVLDHEAGKFITSEEMTITSPNVEFIGTLDRERRSYEMGRARAVMVPTQYIEPFGGVAVEAQLCGTPVITTNWGAFTENVSHGVSGFRPDTMREFVQAIGLSSQLDPVRVREWAASRYSLESVAPQFEDWFDRLDTLWGSGYYEG